MTPAAVTRPICTRCGGAIRDSHRYETEGNGLCVPCMADLAKRARRIASGASSIVHLRSENDRYSGRWHEDISLEIAVEFIRLTNSGWELMEERVWLGYQRRLAEFEEWGKWWKSTTPGRKQQRAAERARYARLKRKIVGYGKCVVCGRHFVVDAYRREKRTDRTCSRRCQANCRRNIRLFTIDGVTRPLSWWADRHGLPDRTVARRLRDGWDIRSALAIKTPRPSKVREQLANLPHEGASELILTALRNARGRRDPAAAELGTTRTSLRRIIDRLQIRQEVDAVTASFPRCRCGPPRGKP